jgi:hypothetical protein
MSVNMVSAIDVFFNWLDTIFKSIPMQTGFPAFAKSSMRLVV